jgi:predicted dehydrogenase
VRVCAKRASASGWLPHPDEPGHQELCEREQRLFLKAIRGEVDLSEHLEDAINSLRIVFAADESMRTGQVVKL